MIVIPEYNTIILENYFPSSVNSGNFFSTLQGSVRCVYVLVFGEAVKGLETDSSVFDWEQCRNI